MRALIEAPQTLASEQLREYICSLHPNAVTTKAQRLTLASPVYCPTLFGEWSLVGVSTTARRRSSWHATLL